MTTLAEVTIYQCGSCSRCFSDEAGIREHQDIYQRLHAFDPEIDEHDGNPWRSRVIRPGEWFGSGRGSFRVTAIEVDDDGDVWVRGFGGWDRQELSLDLAVAVPSVLSGDRAESVPHLDQRLRAMAAAKALDLRDRFGYECPREVSLYKFLHERQMVLSDDMPRLMAEMAYYTATISVYAAQQATLRVR